MYSTIGRASSILTTQRENVVKVTEEMRRKLEDSLRKQRSLGERLVAASVPVVVASAREINDVKVYLSKESEIDEELIVSQGQKCVKADPLLVYVSIAPRGNATRITCFVGKNAVESGASADAIVRVAAKILGGSGGGSKEFAQGGGPRTERADEASEAIYGAVLNLIER